MAIHRKEVVKAISQETGVSNKVVGEVLQSFLSVVKNLLNEGQEFRLTEIGTLYKAPARERNMRPLGKNEGTYIIQPRYKLRGIKTK